MISSAYEALTLMYSMTSDPRLSGWGSDFKGAHYWLTWVGSGIATEGILELGRCLQRCHAVPEFCNSMRLAQLFNRHGCFILKLRFSDKESY